MFQPTNFIRKEQNTGSNNQIITECQDIITGQVNHQRTHSAHTNICTVTCTFDTWLQLISDTLTHFYPVNILTQYICPTLLWINLTQHWSFLTLSYWHTTTFSVSNSSWSSSSLTSSPLFRGSWRGNKNQPVEIKLNLLWKLFKQNLWSIKY